MGRVRKINHELEIIMSWQKKITIISFLLGLIIIFGLIFVYFKNQKSNENLSRFMPKNAQVFAEFNLAVNTLSPAQQNKFKQLTDNLGLLAELPEQIKQAARKIVYLKLENGRTVFLINSQSIRQLISDLPPGFFTFMANPELLMLAKNQSDLLGLSASNAILYQTAVEKETLANFNAENLLNIYFSPTLLKNTLSNSDSALGVILNQAATTASAPAFLGLRAEKNFFNLQLKSNLLPHFNSNSTSELKKFLPLLTSPDGWFKLALTNGQEMAATIWQNFSAAEKENWQQQYEFAWPDLLEIFNTPTLIILQNKSLTAANLALATKYAFVFDFAGKEKIGLEKIKLVKKIITNLLAFSYPSEKNKRLPDGTLIKELIADPSQFKFEQDQKIEFVSEQNFNFALGQKDGFLFLGNSLQLIKNLMAETGKTARALGACSLPNGEVLIINGQKTTDKILGLFDKIVLSSQPGHDSEIFGCLSF